MNKIKQKLRRLAQLAHGGRNLMCDCGACCDACGHDSCCMSRSENQ